MSRYDRAVMHDDFKSIMRMLEGFLEITLLVLLYALCVDVCYDGICYAIFSMKVICVGVYAALVFALFLLSDCFKFGYLKLGALVVAQVICVMIADVLIYFVLCLTALELVPVWGILCLMAVDGALTVALCYVFTLWYHKTNVPHNMLLVYRDERAMSLKFKMDSRQEKYRITETVHTDAGLEAIKSRIPEHDAVILSSMPVSVRNDIMRYCYQNSVRCYIAPEISDIIVTGSREITLFDTPLRLVKGRGLTYQQRFVKRLFDVVLSSIVLAALSPLMLLIAAAIRLSDGGPVFYRQKRVTRDGEVFDILKFRSMVVDAEKQGETMPAVDGDPRITKVGRIIRPMRLDELPQLINIIRGDMSIVGPRPERVEHVQAYSAEIPEWHFREKVRGGLTGYAQVFGKYNTEAYDKLRMDLMYIEHYSLSLDIKLIFMTLRVLFSREAVEGFDRPGREETDK